MRTPFTAYAVIQCCVHHLLERPTPPPLDFYNPKRGCAQTFIFVDPSTGHAYPSVDRGCANLVIR